MHPSVTHHFTVDVEEHFQVNAFDGLVDRASWERHPSRVARSTDRLLELLARHGATGTFFVLGWVAERVPGLVRRIAEAGHEVASHGYAHQRVTTITPAEFRADVRRARALLEDLAGAPVLGYRAPSFSIVPGTEWAFDVLLEEGYRYDSSLFPIRRPGGYGYANAPVDAHVLTRAAGELREFPLATLRVGSARLPAAGGAYLRHLPFALTAGAFRQAAREGRSAVLYVHPWEVDPGQPRLAVPRLTRLRHYGGLARMLPRLERLLGEFRFAAIAPPAAAGTVPSLPAARPAAVVS